MRISFEVGGGLLMRQAHHWAALLLPAVLLLQLLDAFFTGRFRKPRRWQWVLLFGIFVATLLAGWSGYALPDDLLAGTGLRIFQGVVLGIPMIGTALSMLIFGGEFPGTVLANLYPIHVIVAPAALVLLAIARLRLAWKCRPPQFPGPGRTADNVVGLPIWPTMATRWVGMFMITVGVITAERWTGRDQSGMAARSVLGGCRRSRQPARLVYRLPGRCAPARTAGLGTHGVRPHLDSGGDRSAGRGVRLFRRHRRLSLRRAVAHR